MTIKYSCNILIHILIIYSCFYTQVGISIGTTDILEAKPEHIKTLKEGPLNEVKKHNYDTLKFMAEQVKAMVDKLLSMNKFVLLLIPLYVKKREVFDQWQTVLTVIFE